MRRRSRPGVLRRGIIVSLGLLAMAGAGLFLGLAGLESMVAVSVPDRFALPLLLFRLVLYSVVIRYGPVWGRVRPEGMGRTRWILVMTCVLIEAFGVLHFVLDHPG